MTVFLALRMQHAVSANNGDPATALLQYNRRESMDANLAKLRAIEAEIRAGKLPEAAAALNALSRTAPYDPRIYLTGAMLARAAGNSEHEIASLRRAVALAPQWGYIHAALAKTLARDDRHAEAVAEANRAVELSGNDIKILETAVKIANAAGDTATALRHLQAARAIRPLDTTIGLALATALTNLQRHAEAEPYWREAAAANRDDLYTLVGWGICLLGLERTDEARVMFERAEALEPANPTVQFYADMARGDTPRTQLRVPVRELFDGYAGRFDMHLVGELKYRVPRRVAEILVARSPDLSASILDLGCGTGLLGVYLGRVNGPFVGIDLSAKMIAQAARHRIYTELREADLGVELQRTPPGSFDYIVANDVFVYYGDISAVIPAAHKALRSGGALIFSCETADESEGAALVLRASRRYAHSVSSVERLCREAGFARCAIETLELRLERNVPIPGFIAIAEKA